MTKERKKQLLAKVETMEIVAGDFKYTPSPEYEVKKAEWRIKFGEKWKDKTLFDLCITGD